MKKNEEPEEVTVSVEGCVIDWKHKVQVNPKTGEKYDFNGNKL